MKKLIPFLFFSALVLATEPSGRYKTILTQMEALQKQYPAVSEIFSIGANDDGVEIYALRVSLTPAVMDPRKIGQMMVSTHHGNESATPILTMNFIRELLKKYSSSELWRGQLSDMEWTIIPVLNISGYNANQRAEHGRDPNRDYPNPCLTAPGMKLMSIKRLIQYMDSRVFVGSVTVHGYDGSLTYPWGVYTNNTQTLDHNLFEKVFKKAASFNGYRTGTAADVVYPANGAYEDWVYWKHGSWSLLLELASGSEKDIRDTTQAILSFYDQLDATPSGQHDFTATCTHRRWVKDIRLE